MPTAIRALANTTLASTASSVTFSSIAGTYRDLILVVNGTTAGASSVTLRFNSDTGANYSSVIMEGNGTNAGSGNNASQTALFNTYAYNSTNTTGSVHVFNIMDYTATDKHKVVLSRTNNTSLVTAAAAGRWANTAAITTVEVRSLSSSFAVGTNLSLFGVSS
jgi:hypothetical protein